MVNIWLQPFCSDWPETPPPSRQIAGCGGCHPCGCWPSAGRKQSARHDPPPPLPAKTTGRVQCRRVGAGQHQQPSEESNRKSAEAGAAVRVGIVAVKGRCHLAITGNPCYHHRHLQECCKYILFEYACDNGFARIPRLLETLLFPSRIGDDPVPFACEIDWGTKLMSRVVSARPAMPRRQVTSFLKSLTGSFIETLQLHGPF
jgi:hypothetical protein